MQIDGKSYDVEVGDLGHSPVVVHVNGKEFLVEVQQPNLEASSVSTAKFSEPSVVTEIKPAPSAFGARPQNQPEAFSEAVVKAPMPGKILDIVVKPGDHVNRGDALCSLEAMKMKSVIRSPRAGEIASVDVAEGQRVLFGDVLIRFK